MVKLITTVATIALAAFPFVAAQTVSDCDPTKQVGCPNKPGLTQAEYNVDFTQVDPATSSDWKTTSGAITKGPDGAEFSIKELADGPTIQSNWYIFFGYVEVKMKAAQGQGIVSSFVMESDDLDEIDWEFIGSQGSQGQSNYFGKGNTTTYDRAKFHPVSATDAFHTYAVNWTQEMTTWLIDGVPVRSLNFDEAVGGKNYPQTPMNIRLGNWVGGNPKNQPGTIEWAGGLVDMSQAPFKMFVQSVKVINYGPGESYKYGDQTGSFSSIQIVSATNNNTQAPPVQVEPSSATSSEVPSAPSSEVPSVPSSEVPSAPTSEAPSVPSSEASSAAPSESSSEASAPSSEASVPSSAPSSAPSSDSSSDDSSDDGSSDDGSSDDDSSDTSGPSDESGISQNQGNQGNQVIQTNQANQATQALPGGTTYSIIPAGISQTSNGANGAAGSTVTIDPAGVTPTSNGANGANGAARSTVTINPAGVTPSSNSANGANGAAGTTFSIIPEASAPTGDSACTSSRFRGDSSYGSVMTNYGGGRGGYPGFGMVNPGGLSPCTTSSPTNATISLGRVTISASEPAFTNGPPFTITVDPQTARPTTVANSSMTATDGGAANGGLVLTGAALNETKSTVSINVGSNNTQVGSFITATMGAAGLNGLVGASPVSPSATTFALVNGSGPSPTTGKPAQFTGNAAVRVDAKSWPLAALSVLLGFGMIGF